MIHHKYYAIMPFPVKTVTHKLWISLSIDNAANKLIHINWNLTQDFEHFLNTKHDDIIEYDKLQIIGMTNREEECHILGIIQNELGYCVHISYNITDNGFKILQLINNYNLIADQHLISNDKFVYNIESTLFVHSRSRSPPPPLAHNNNNITSSSPCAKLSKYVCANRRNSIWTTTTKRIKRGNVKCKFRFNCCVFVKGNYCIIIEKPGQIYVLDVSFSCIYEVNVSLFMHWTNGWTGKFRAIIISCNENKDDIAIAGFMRNMIIQTPALNNCYPPQHILKLLDSFYCNEEIFIMHQDSISNVFGCWKFVVDIIFDNLTVDDDDDDDDEHVFC